jgi:hypothetical protein
MSDKNTIVAVYDTRQDTENAVNELQKVGFDLQKLSIVGRDHRSATGGMLFAPGNWASPRRWSASRLHRESH